MTNLGSQWSEFIISDLFDVKIGKNVDGNKVDKNSGNIAYITRKECDNGLDGFISYDETFLNNHGPVITIGNETACPYVQVAPFFTGTKVNILIPRQPMKVETLFFIAEAIRKQKSKFSYSYTINSTRLKRQKILLPVIADGSPDFECMSKLVLSIKLEKSRKFRDFASNLLSNLSYKKIVKLNEKFWDEFFIEDIASIHSGRDIYDAERVEGDNPYISATAQRNGIGYFVGNKNATLESGCLSVNRNGSVGYSFYHPYEALFSNDCRKLKIKDKTAYVGFFVANQITMQKEKYNYGYKMGTGRLKRQKIMLPVNDEGAPDYEYMSQFIQNLFHEKISRYVSFAETSVAKMESI